MKLILFDIDGTLINTAGASQYELTSSESKFSYAIRKIFHTESTINLSLLHGSIDRKILWDIASPLGITHADFEAHFDTLVKAMHEYLEKTVTDTSLYKAILSAKQFIHLIVQNKNIAYGILSGNVRSIAEWKLEKAGYDHMFQFGLFGEEADDRIELAKKVFVKADAFFHKKFAPTDIIVVGDTVYDVRCGKAIGAHTIAVLTGRHANPTSLNAEHPDFLVDSLMDNSVLDYVGVKQV